MTLWAILNSPLVLSLLPTLLLAIMGKAVVDKTRRQKLLDYAAQAFDVAEMIGRVQGMSGVQKYALFLRELAKSMKTAGEKPLTLQEEQQLDVFAHQRSWITKQLPKVKGEAPAIALPLPAPKGGNP